MPWEQELPLIGKMTPENVSNTLNKMRATNPAGEKWTRETWGWRTQCAITMLPIERAAKTIKFRGSMIAGPESTIPERFRANAVSLGYPVGELDERTST